MSGETVTIFSIHNVLYVQRLDAVTQSKYLQPTLLYLTAIFF